jgi:hypothetical protein
MTVSVVERRPREASSPLNPAYTRFALRGLVVAGFAGGVRLLSGSAAHASDGHGGHAPDSTATMADLATELGGNGVDDFLGRPRGGAAPTPPAPATTQVAHPVRHNTSGGTGLGGLAGPLAPTGLGSAAGATRQPAPSVYRADRVGSRHGPAGPRRDPLRAVPDPGLPGASTTASMSHHLGGGVLAVVPTTATGDPEANRRAIPAGDVEAIRLIAEAPSVSPDWRRVSRPRPSRAAGACSRTTPLKVEHTSGVRRRRATAW